MRTYCGLPASVNSRWWFPLLEQRTKSMQKGTKLERYCISRSLWHIGAPWWGTFKSEFWKNDPKVQWDAQANVSGEIHWDFFTLLPVKCFSQWITVRDLLHRWWRLPLPRVGCSETVLCLMLVVTPEIGLCVLCADSASTEISICGSQALC